MQVLAICLVLFYASRINAQSLPPPTPPPIDEPVPGDRTSATVFFADATEVYAHSIDGRFRLVGLHLNETVDITVQFPTGWEKTHLTVQALDGGDLFPQSADTVIADDGSTSFQFRAGNQPGLYRISMIGAGGSSILSFWVADPTNPQANPPTANPSH